MKRIACAFPLLLLSACATTSTVQQQHAPAPGLAYAYTFENNGGDDLAGIARLARIVQERLGDAGLLAEAATANGRVEVELTHYQVTVLDASGNRFGRFEVDTTNLTAWGSKDGLMEAHAEEIVARLKH